MVQDMSETVVPGTEDLATDWKATSSSLLRVPVEYAVRDTLVDV